MRIKLDENLRASLKGLFAAAGHDVATVSDERLSGATDDRVLARATSEQRILVTLDRGFGNVRVYQPDASGGIVVFRLDDQRLSAIEDSARRLIASGILERMGRGLVIVEPERIRVRTST